MEKEIGRMDSAVAGTKYEPISTDSFVGILLLMLVPLVNIVMLIVWASGGCRRVNIRNFARAALLAYMIAAVALVLVLCILYIIAGSELFTSIAKMLRSMADLFGNIY